MSTTEIIAEQEHASAEVARLLYVCEFPPCNCHGGAILLRRLLEDYSAKHLLVIASSNGMRLSTDEERLRCRHISFPVLGVSRFLWFGRLKHLFNWIILGVACCTAVLNILWKRIDVVLTVLQGRFYFAGALAAYLTGTPYIVVVHDDFISTANKVSRFSENILRPLTERVLKGAAHLYAVSPEMQSFLMREFGVDSELQLPARARASEQASSTFCDLENGPVVVFAGGASFAVQDSVDLLAKLITTGAVAEYGVPNLKLRLFSMLSTEQAKAFGWDHPNIEVKGWVPQSELLQGLAGGDILLLPYSFAEASRHAVQTAFPSKTADYLASGKPILVVAPSFSTLVRYARQEGFAEIVDECSADALGQALQNIAFSPKYRASLVERAQQAFAKNHDIANQRKNFSAVLSDLAASS